MSTRIFVRGLPPTLTEADLRAHFAKHKDLTDVRLIPNRRIGYIGYKTAEDAQAAVKYFNKSFIRMSKINVEIATSVADRAEIPNKNRPMAHDDSRKRQKLSPPTEGADNKLKRKHDDKAVANADAPPNKKFQEFLNVMAPSGKSNTWSNADHADNTGIMPVAETTAEDEEYVDLVPLKTIPQPEAAAPVPVPMPRTEIITTSNEDSQTQEQEPTGPVSDADWLRSRTSRLLDVTDDVSSRFNAADASSSTAIVAPAVASLARPVAQPEVSDVAMTDAAPISNQSELDKAIETISQSGRLFVRNLPYSASEDDLRQHFAAHGELQEVHLPIDTKSQTSKGFVYVLYKAPADAVEAYKELDRKEFQGRLLHIIPAAPKRENKLDDFAISKLPLKKQRELKRKAAAATSQFSWNSLYMNADAVISSVAAKLGVSKSDLLDPTSSDAAVKQAHAETHVINETKSFLTANGINLAAFSNKPRDDKVLLLKNFPYGTKPDELRKLLQEFGDLAQLLFPPAGTIAIAEFLTAPAARAAFTGLSYRRFKDGILFLEKAPLGLFTGRVSGTNPAPIATGIDARPSASDLHSTDSTTDSTATTPTLFVRNLSFTTTADGFTAAFSALDGFQWARVKTKIDPRKPGQTLSMGFGFVGFSTAAQAAIALAAMDGYNLDGHRLLVKGAHKGADAAAETKASDAAKSDAMKGTKVIIKNLPFEVTKRDVRELFGKYGTLRAIRMPTKVGNRTRGFAFAEFVTARDAANAMESLKDTHLLGRRLVLDYAQQDAGDAEEEIDRMTKKAGKQTDLVSLAKLHANTKTKVVLDESGAVEDLDA